MRSMLCFSPDIAVIDLQKRRAETNSNDSQSLALAVCPDVVNDSRYFPLHPILPHAL